MKLFLSNPLFLTLKNFISPTLLILKYHSFFIKKNLNKLWNFRLNLFVVEGGITAFFLTFLTDPYNTLLLLGFVGQMGT